MNSFWIGVISLAYICGLVDGQFISSLTNRIHVIAEPSNEFTLNLYHTLRNFPTNNENMILSGYSLRTIMALLVSGASGDTSAEIQNQLYFPANNLQLHRDYEALLGKSNLNIEDEGSIDSKVTLHQQNRLFIKSGFQINETFEKISKSVFGSPTVQIDFSNPEKAATEINSWVENTTNSRIQQILEPDSLNTFTRLVAINTIYFKGAWADRFDEGVTSRKPFYNSPRERTFVDMMQIDEYMPTINLTSINVKGIAIPYEGRRFFMVILLPNVGTTLAETEKLLSRSNFTVLRHQLSKMKTRYIHLSIPKFKLESTYDFVDAMKKMSIRKLFDEKDADLSGIVNPAVDQLYVSKLTQKAFLTVDEKGSEAGAATAAILLTPLSLRPKTIEEEIIVDRPFLGFIYDSVTQAILFMFRKSTF